MLLLDMNVTLIYFQYRGEGFDMNVQKAWAMGVTGKGVAVTILDDGIETEHPDLKKNYVSNRKPLPIRDIVHCLFCL